MVNFENTFAGFEDLYSDVKDTFDTSKSVIDDFKIMGSTFGSQYEYVKNTTHDSLHGNVHGVIQDTIKHDRALSKGLSAADHLLVQGATGLAIAARTNPVATVAIAPVTTAAAAAGGVVTALQGALAAGDEVLGILDTLGSIFSKRDSQPAPQPSPQPTPTPSIPSNDQRDIVKGVMDGSIDPKDIGWDQRRAINDDLLSDEGRKWMQQEFNTRGVPTSIIRTLFPDRFSN